MAGVYEGLQVLDLSWGTAGPMTTMLLADNGADVTRIVPPDGDPFAGQSGYRVWNRGKRSAVLDLKSADGKAAFEHLAATADLVVDSFSLGTMDRLGLGHDALSARNPGLISLSISGYGNHPLHRDRPGIDALVAARTGLLYDQKGRRGTALEYICGRPGPDAEFDVPEGLVRGADRSGPVFPRSTWPSLGATYFASVGIAAALRARAVTGRGQRVETSLLQGALAAVSLNWQRVEDPDAPMYWMWPIDSRSIEGLYECADGRWVHHWTVRPNWVLTSAKHDVMTEVDLDGAYRDDPDRISMDASGMLAGMFLHPLLTDAFRKFPAEQWVHAAEVAQMGMAAVRSPAEALADPAFLADGCVVEVDDPEVGRIRHVGNLLEFSATPGAVRGPTAASGQHTDEVRTESSTASSARPSASTAPSGATLAHPLDGIRVLDLGLGVAGPFVGRVLADLGADVIKVHALHDTFWAGTHMGLGTNRGKRSISVNLKHPEGVAALHRLVASADVVTTNWRPGAAARLGLDWETLHAHHPALVWCNTRGFEKGPRSDLPGTDQTAAALTGTEWEDGACDTGNPPLWSRSNMGDTGNALLATTAIIAALYHRERTGEGQAVGTSIVNAGLLHTSYAWIDAAGTPTDWGHVDADQYGLSPYYRMYRCADDRWIFVAALDGAAEQRMLDALGVDGQHRDDAVKLAAVAEERFVTASAAEWFATLDPSVDVEIVDEAFCRDLFDDPEARSLDLIVETWTPAVGRFEDPGLLVGFSETPGIIRRGPALCGEHTREILLEHGYTSDDVDRLVAERVVLDAPAP
ncbi:MAG: L-carnitine dehydratase/bile acid-inducible protein [Ilumatobacteraceae bacterium]|nr:L-carnitine dehydratase/bile acid-inducible protein [Ilumatobacteraceae bacterium]